MWLRFRTDRVTGGTSPFAPHCRADSLPRAAATTRAALAAFLVVLCADCNAYDARLLPPPGRSSGVDAEDDLDGGPLGWDGRFDSQPRCTETGDPDCPMRCREACNGSDDDCDGRIDEIDSRSLCRLPFATTVCALTGHGEDHKPTCLIATCLDHHADCNELVEDGCESTLDSADQCGLCGHACSLPNATAGCAEGGCRIESCDSGYEDCDGNPENGCEVTLNSLTACGGCGHGCSAAQASTECDAGACKFRACSAGFGDCNRDAAKLEAGDGCESDLNSPSNCGACGRVCPPDRPFCSGGRCSSVACPTLQADCDGDNVTCETDLRTAQNCGSCGTRCGPLANADVSCASGSCVPTCKSGFKDCDRAQQDGCETDVRTVEHCGECARSCNFPNASTACTNGSCRLLGCLSGFGDCNDDLSRDGCEQRLNTNRDCGQCGRSCSLANANETCSSGSCQIGSCSAGFGNCDGQAANGCEIDLNNDARNCGSCGNVCTNGLSCRSGRCACTANANCGSNQTCCNGNCVDTRSNAANCGACGSACAGGSTCCDGSCVNTMTDVDHCGGCDERCDDDGDRCVAGRCRCGDGDPCDGLERCCDERCRLLCL